ncbi:helix-turn-helix domain-containing protein [Enterococcus raffinosus]|jgi:transcriptional regulator with XRE-family HTH domain|uniref:helix-turn-helix domain-containing protein n=1 Tax=Enterococcus TaxID=1350 RepID=UPI00066173F8|nr:MULTISPECIES: helix-turn-helix domain-containing protein [Enterococcus]SAM78249.1 helix-turn-helix domain-containing protein [Enterococcus faecium]DAZ20667.1 MAG TPA: Repressor protein CI [Caudoviricetes sp.]MZJ57075.1 helix-turn-helix domain-containing protein [Enterococcus avium]MZJ77578.1 helix-turn-helix domain-containing protein [Enterococcus avium]MZJ81837.1 helix-turn-helix domain-containing protein [Enterococcus avium]
MAESIIGRQIQSLRNKYRMTQEDLASKLGVSKQTVSNWETGLKTPRMGAIQKLSELFNVSKSFIIEGKQDNQDGLLAIYDQLDDARKNEVIDFAKFKLVEQNRSQIFTLAAHSDDPNKIVSDDDLNNINSALDEMDRKFDKK